MDVKIFQFNGCNKCYDETLLLKLESGFNVHYIEDPKSWKEEKTEIAVITGFLLPEDSDSVDLIAKYSKKVIAYGNCATFGGVYALANQKGHKIIPLRNFVSHIFNINGCLAEIEELVTEIKGETHASLKSLCTVCKRKSTCNYMKTVHRQIEIDDYKTCFNDLGFLCNGFIAKECKERCIAYEAPCRGCKPIVERSGIRMLGMFGTLMGNIEVATEHSVKGATDKLADEEDDVVRSLPDVLGNFFRFTLPVSGLPQGRVPSTGTILEDVFHGRLIEELPLISGLLGGNKSISLTLKILEAYESANKINLSEETKKYRKDLLKFEGELLKAIEKQDAKKYQEISSKIRKIAGNRNLSNMNFGGFRAQIDDTDGFGKYKAHPFEVIEGYYHNGGIEFKLDSDGKVNEFKIKENLL